ncbi:MAG: hypothetical protein Tsb0034_25440 [Ekhidna sp.]
MKYHFTYENPIDHRIAGLLSEELQRYDIRSEISGLTTLAYPDEKVDVAIHVGGIVSKKSRNVLKRIGDKKILVYQGLYHRSSSRKLKFPQFFHRVYLDLPYLDATDFRSLYKGNLLWSALKKVDGAEEDTGIIFVDDFGGSYDRQYNSLKQKWLQASDQRTLSTVSFQKDFEDAKARVEASSAVIVSCDFGELVAVALNTPALRIAKNGLFSKSVVPITDKLLDRAVIPTVGASKTDLIAKELLKILEDHQYCSGILEDYQKVKEIIGLEPAAREIGRDITEWCDE